MSVHCCGAGRSRPLPFVVSPVDRRPRIRRLRVDRSLGRARCDRCTSNLQKVFVRRVASPCLLLQPNSHRKGAPRALGIVGASVCPVLHSHTQPLPCPNSEDAHSMPRPHSSQLSAPWRACLAVAREQLADTSPCIVPWAFSLAATRARQTPPLPVFSPLQPALGALPLRRQPQVQSLRRHAERLLGTHSARASAVSRTGGTRGRDDKWLARVGRMGRDHADR